MDANRDEDCVEASLRFAQTFIAKSQSLLRTREADSFLLRAPVWVISRVTLANLRSSPESSKSAVRVTLAQNRSPFLRTRHPSAECTPDVAEISSRSGRRPRGLPAIEHGDMFSENLVGE